MWLVQQNKILTTNNLTHKRLTDYATRIFCDSNETVEHLFIHYFLVSCILNWIANYNYFL
jgi:hypothetical protein